MYQMYVVAAMKMHCLLKAMPCRPFRNAPLLLDAIDQAVRYLPRLMRSRAADARRRTGVPCRLAVPASHVRYLGLHAFARVLGAKQSLYPAVLASLRAAMRAPEFLSARRSLGPVVAPGRHATLGHVRF